MISNLNRILLFIAFTVVTSIHAQDTKYFSLSAGVNIIDNSNGKIVPWDAKRVEFSSPFYVEFDYRFNTHFSVALLGTANVFDIRTLDALGTGYVTNSYDFFGLDISGKYFLDQLFFDNNNIDLYAGVGLGFHDMANDNAFTGNLNVGFNYWFNTNFGASIQAIAKKSIGEEIAFINNYYQYNIGVSYRFLGRSKAEKRETLAEDAEPKAEVKSLEENIVEIIEDNKEENSAIDTNQEFPSENSAGKESIIKQNADQETSSEEQSAQSSTGESQLSTLQKELNDLGVIYFDRNSSFYYKSEKLKLDAIIRFLLANENVHVTINSYTDPTGTEKYNNWLSERRLQRVQTYVISNGVAADRLDSFSKGVDILNTCNQDHTNCTEKEHQLQRRVEFIIKK